MPVGDTIERAAKLRSLSRIIKLPLAALLKRANDFSRGIERQSQSVFGCAPYTNLVCKGAGRGGRSQSVACTTGDLVCKGGGRGGRPQSVASTTDLVCKVGGRGGRPQSVFGFAASTVVDLFCKGGGRERP